MNQAYENGRIACMDGVLRENNPYDEASEAQLHADWLDGWNTFYMSQRAVWEES